MPTACNANSLFGEYVVYASILLCMPYLVWNIECMLHAQSNILSRRVERCKKSMRYGGTKGGKGAERSRRFSVK